MGIRTPPLLLVVIFIFVIVIVIAAIVILFVVMLDDSTNSRFSVALDFYSYLIKMFVYLSSENCSQFIST